MALQSLLVTLPFSIETLLVLQNAEVKTNFPSIPRAEPWAFAENYRGVYAESSAPLTGTVHLLDIFATLSKTISKGLAKHCFSHRALSPTCVPPLGGAESGRHSSSPQRGGAFWRPSVKTTLSMSQLPTGKFLRSSASHTSRSYTSAQLGHEPSARGSPGQY